MTRAIWKLTVSRQPEGKGLTCAWKLTTGGSGNCENNLLADRVGPDARLVFSIYAINNGLRLQFTYVVFDYTSLFIIHRTNYYPNHRPLRREHIHILDHSPSSYPSISSPSLSSTWDPCPESTEMSTTPLATDEDLETRTVEKQ